MDFYLHSARKTFFPFVSSIRDACSRRMGRGERHHDPRRSEASLPADERWSSSNPSFEVGRSAYSVPI
jgi:hypothetical protein